MVFAIALLAAVFRSGQSLVHRYALSRIMKGNYVWYAGVFNLVSAVFFLPLFLLEFSLPILPLAWLLALLSMALWLCIALVSFKSYMHTEVALRAPLSETRLLWVLLFSWLALSETITAGKLFGVLLMIFSFFILAYEKGKLARLRDIGVKLTLLTAFLSALVSIVDKAAMAFWPPDVYGFLMYLVPGLAIMTFGHGKHGKAKIKIATKRNVAYVLLGALMGMLFYYFELLALSAADASTVVPIFRLSTVFTVLGGIIFLKERRRITRRLFAAALAFIAVLFVAGFV